MVLKKYYINIITRIVLISLNSFVFIISTQQPKHFFTIGITGALFILQIMLLIRYLNNTNRDLINFYESIVNQDSTISLLLKRGKGDQELNKIFNEVNQKLSSLKVEKESQYQYLKHIIDHLETGLITFNGKGQIELVNKAALKLFKTPTIDNIRDLNRIQEGLGDIILSLPSEKQRVVKFSFGSSILYISLRTTSFRLQDNIIQLVSFHDINNEVDETEQKSWEKLIRVLTHEIMNSISPINSLTTTLCRIYQSGEGSKSIDQLRESDINDTISGLDIIDKRSRGLMQFVKKYHQIYSIPKPIKESFRIKEILEGIRQLHIDECQDHRISFDINVFPENLEIFADKAMIEQVLINLVKNAIESFDFNVDGIIEMIAFRNETNQPTIQVKDNGKGIAPSILDDIFVPFFTTKNNGSGIGLSLSRQIMQLHNGNIRVQSEESKGSTFSLVF